MSQPDDDSRATALPDVHFGSPEDGMVDWREGVFDDETPDDDEELPRTPDEVVKLLGFDPLDI